MVFAEGHSQKKKQARRPAQIDKVEGSGKKRGQNTTKFHSKKKVKIVEYCQGGRVEKKGSRFFDKREEKEDLKITVLVLRTQKTRKEKGLRLL